MNQVATTSNDLVLVPEAKLAEVNHLEKIIIASQTQIAAASAFTRAITMAAALREIKQALSPEIMKDMMALMDTPVGFKTDRKPGNKKKLPPYTVEQVKDCMIVALLYGASLAGNEFNILVNSPYFTKEFYTRAVNEWPGITHIQVDIGGAAKHGANTAALPATASWVLNGEEFEMKFEKKTEEQGGADMRIIVASYDTDGPDLLRGKALKKVYERIHQRLSGLNLTEVRGTVDGEVVGGTPQNIADKSNQPALTDESGGEEKKPFKASEDPHYKAAVAMYNAAKEEIVATKGIKACDAALKARLKEMTNTPWSEPLFDEVSKNLEELAEAHKETLRRN